MLLHRQFLRFAAVGLCGTGVQYVSLWLGVECLGAAAPVASAVGYIFGSMVNYTLNYVFTFHSQKPHIEAVSKYYAVLLVGWSLNTGLMTLFTSQQGLPYFSSVIAALGLASYIKPYILPQLVTTGIGLFWNFSGSRLWAFKQKR